MAGIMPCLVIPSSQRSPTRQEKRWSVLHLANSDLRQVKALGMIGLRTSERFYASCPHVRRHNLPRSAIGFDTFLGDAPDPVRSNEGLGDWYFFYPGKKIPDR